MLWAFGFAEAPSGLWRRRGSEEAKLLADNRAMTLTTGFDRATKRQLAQEFRQRVEHFANTGKAPPAPDWKRLDWLKPPLWMRPIVALEERGVLARLDRFLRRIRRD